MTALMVLFLVVMSVTLLRVTATLSEADSAQTQLDKDVAAILRQFSDAAARFPGIKVFHDRKVVDFGQQALFDRDSYGLSPEQGRALRRFLPEVLKIADSDLGKKVLKRIVVEGFTDRTGSYLWNLNLSLQRSQRVLCTMLDKPLPGEVPLSDLDKEQIRALFVVGGFSSNATRASDEESRRVEMRLEFFGAVETRIRAAAASLNGVGECALK